MRTSLTLKRQNKTENDVVDGDTIDFLFVSKSKLRSNQQCI